MNSLRKMLAILDLFDAPAPLISADEIIGKLNYSRPQGYRYIKELCAAGLLIRFKSGYTLGPRCIEFDFLIRQNDPFLHASEPVMQQVSRQNGCDVLLASMYGDRIVAVHHERGSDPTTISFGRGRRMPLLRGAGSKVILAALPRAMQMKLVEAHQRELASSMLGQSWEEISAALKAIRKSGYAISVGELDPSNVGIGVPLGAEEAAFPSSIVLVLSAARYKTTSLNSIVEVALSCRDAILSRLAAMTSLSGTPRERSQHAIGK
jgi:DNA-binding IclR family transcriptional regulator